MFSCKTSKLLMELERFKYQHKKVVVFKPQQDVRYGIDDVVSHSGWKTPAIVIKTGADVIEVLAALDEQPQVIVVDEAFMIPGIAETLTWLFRNGYNVLVSTLDLSSACKPFGEVEKMLPWATCIEKCSAVCTVCGDDASYTYRKLVSDEEIQVGGSELYEPRCFACHPMTKLRDEFIG
jgi:thymidine kinase